MFKFTDATSIYQKFDKEYEKHDRCYVILDLSCIGKSTYVKNQKK